MTIQNDNARVRAETVQDLTSPDKLGIFLGDRSQQVRAAVAAHPLLTPTQRRVLVHDRDAAVRVALAVSHRTDDVLDALAVDPNENVRYAVARGPHLAASLALRLARDSSTRVHNAVIEAHATTVVFDPLDVLAFSRRFPRDIDDRLNLPTRQQWPSIIVDNDAPMGLRCTLTVLCRRARLLDDLLWDDTTPQPLRAAAIANPRTSRLAGHRSVVA